jgi:hypothetical protein
METISQCGKLGIAVFTTDSLPVAPERHGSDHTRIQTQPLPPPSSIVQGLALNYNGLLLLFSFCSYSSPFIDFLIFT